MPYTVYKRGATAAAEEGLSYLGESELSEPLNAALDVEYRENGCDVAVGEVYAVLDETGKQLDLVKITQEPQGEAV